MENFIDTEVKRIQALVGPTAEVIGAVSGGVDSTVASAIMKRLLATDTMLFTSITVSCVFTKPKMSKGFRRRSWN